jgi:nitrite reductase (NADH) small subunit
VNWTPICSVNDLVVNAGVAAMHDHQQVALFYQLKPTEKVYAIANWDPIAEANVLSRGLIVDVDGAFYVASPLYKQRYHLETGQCKDAETSVPVWCAKIENGTVWVA